MFWLKINEILFQLLILIGGLSLGSVLIVKVTDQSILLYKANLKNILVSPYPTLFYGYGWVGIFF